MTSKRGTNSPRGDSPITRKSKSTSRFTPDQLIIGGSIVITVIIAAAVMYASIQNSYLYSSEIEGVEYYASLIATHVNTPVTYPLTPPVGGSHSPVWQTCGVYSEPIANEHAVHSLEHGAVWITYQPDLPADQIQTLQNLTRQSSHRLLSPYVSITSPVIVSSWGYQLRLESADDPRLAQFVAQYEQGPNTPEPGATCSGGETRTLLQLMPQG